jgi:hypothetical protein
MKLDNTMLNFDLNKIILNDDYYGHFKDLLLKRIVENYDNRKNNVKVLIDKTVINMKEANLLTNLTLLNPFNVFKVPVTKDFIFKTTEIDSSSISKYMTRLINYFKGHDYNQLNYSLAEIIRELDIISAKANVLHGNTISIKSILDLAEENESIWNLLNFSVPFGLQFSEIEEMIGESYDNFCNILMDTENCLNAYLASKTGINKKQLGQTFVCVGSKPDLMGNIMDDIINTSFFRGMRNVKDFYIGATGGRKALITNFKQVKNAGYLTRKLSLLMVDTKLDYSLEDCSTSHYIDCFVKEEETLKRLMGRWYLKDGYLYEINTKSLELIGQTINLRSPIKCCHPEGKICRRCYGDNLAKLNQNLHVGIIAVLFLTNILTQMLLSSKHLLQTKSNKIDWSDEFLEYFTVDKNTILFNEIESLSLVINLDNIVEDEDEESFSINTFYIKKGKDKKTLIKSPISLIISDELMNLIKDYKNDNSEAIIPLKLFDPNSIPFYIIAENNELSASLHSILELIENNDHLGCKTITEVYNKFISLLNESSINIDSVHIELIIRELIREVENQTKKPDFSQESEPEYVILRVTDAILKSPSVSVSLVFEQIKKQLMNPEIYEKDGESVLDILIS